MDKVTSASALTYTVLHLLSISAAHTSLCGRELARELRCVACRHEGRGAERVACIGWRSVLTCDALGRGRLVASRERLLVSLGECLRHHREVTKTHRRYPPVAVDAWAIAVDVEHYLQQLAGLKCRFDRTATAQDSGVVAECNRQERLCARAALRRARRRRTA
jgi:hypothetical protein